MLCLWKDRNLLKLQMARQHINSRMKSFNITSSTIEMNTQHFAHSCRIDNLVHTVYFSGIALFDLNPVHWNTCINIVLVCIFRTHHSSHPCLSFFLLYIIPLFLLLLFLLHLLVQAKGVCDSHQWIGVGQIQLEHRMDTPTITTLSLLH